METYINIENLDKKTENWLEAIAGFNTHRMQLNISKTGLLVIDLQKYFLNPQSSEYTPSGNVILPKIKYLIEVCRKTGIPVIYTRHAHHHTETDAGIMKWWWEGMCLENSPESLIADEIAPMPDERVIIKRRYSAFFNTDLETILRCMNIEDLIICGIMTNMCCESTARDAYYRDFRVFFLADATGSITEEMHLASLLNLAFGFAYVTDTNKIINEIYQNT